MGDHPLATPLAIAEQGVGASDPASNDDVDQKTKEDAATNLFRSKSPSSVYGLSSTPYNSLPLHQQHCSQESQKMW